MDFLSQKITCLLAVLVVPILAVTCSNQVDHYDESEAMFTGPINMGKVEHDDIDEASGLAASRINKNMLWTHNDSGDDARLFLMTDSARHVGVFYLKDAVWRDAEDIAIGPGPKESISYIYLGDIGDNWARNEIKQIYRFPEPNVSGRKRPITDTIKNYDVFHYRFPDAIRDAETLMIDPNTKDLYIVSKREINVVMYKMAYPYAPNDTVTLEIVGNLPLSIIVGGDISPDGSEVLLKSYNEIYYYKLKPGEGIESIIHKQPERLPYAIEPQGEAIAWSADASGYYTVSEEVLMISAVLYFYERIEELKNK
jgi:hypothetical protein